MQVSMLWHQCNIYIYICNITSSLERNTLTATNSNPCLQYNMRSLPLAVSSSTTTLQWAKCFTKQIALITILSTTTFVTQLAEHGTRFTPETKCFEKHLVNSGARLCTM